MVVKSTAIASRNASASSMRSASAVRPSRSIATQTQFNISTALEHDSDPQSPDTSDSPTSSSTTVVNNDALADAQQASTIRYVALVALAAVLMGFLFWMYRKYKARHGKTVQRERAQRALRRDVQLSRWQTIFRYRSNSGATAEELPEYEGKLPRYPTVEEVRVEEPISRTDTQLHGSDVARSSVSSVSHDSGRDSPHTSATRSSRTYSSFITDTSSDRHSETSFDAITRTRTDGASSFHTDSDVNL